jgi:hypothetical protein
MAVLDVAPEELGEPRTILELIHRLHMGERELGPMLAHALGEPDLASEHMETVETAIARMNTRVRRRSPQDFKRELQEAAARMARRAHAWPTLAPSPTIVRTPRRTGARAPRARRVTRARSPAGSRAGDDDPEPEPRPLDLLDAALLVAGWARE